jgi:hypothetical protein
MQVYPLTLDFAPRQLLRKLIVKNAQGSPVMQAERSMTLKSKFEVCAYQKYGQDNYTIVAPKLMQWKMAYDFWNQQGEPIGRIQSSPKPSQYNLYTSDRLAFGVNLIRNPYRLLFMIPMALCAIGFLCQSNELLNIVMFGRCLLGLAIVSAVAMYFAGLHHESYLVRRPDGRPVMQFARSNMRRFSIKAIDDLSDAEEPSLLLGVILLILQDQESYESSD